MTQTKPSGDVACFEKPSQIEGTQARFFSWPDATRIKTFLVLGAMQSAWFGVVYGGCDKITSWRTDLVRVHFDFEETIPFVPDLIWIYASIYLLFLAIPFVADSPQRLKTIALALASATGVAGVVFLLIPAEPDFPIPASVGFVPSVFHLSDWVNLNFNQVPSLHIAFTFICAESFTQNASRTGKLLLRFWPIAVAIAAVCTFQHHLVDVVAGYAVGLVSYFVSRRWVG